MIDALAANPLTYAGLALLLAAFVWRDRLRLGAAGLTAAAMFVVSTFLITFYHYGEGVEQQIAFWQGGLLVDGILYVLILNARERLRWALAGAVLVGGFFYGAFLTDGLAQKWFWFGQISAIAALAWGCYLTVRRDDITGQLLWAVLGIGEVFSAAQVLDCQMLHGMAAEPVTEGSACATVYGFIAAPYATVAPLSVVWAYLIYRWVRPRPA